MHVPSVSWPLMRLNLTSAVEAATGGGFMDHTIKGSWAFWPSSFSSPPRVLSTIIIVGLSLGAMFATGRRPLLRSGIPLAVLTARLNRTRELVRKAAQVLFRVCASMRSVKRRNTDSDLASGI